MWNNRFKSLVVVPQSHTAPLRDPKNHANINWDPCWDDPAVESQAVLLDPRPQLSPNDCLATMVLWNSRTIHCSGNHLPRKRTATQSAFLSGPPCRNGHFDVSEHQAWTKYLEAHGYVVLELKMTREEHAAHVFRFRQAVQLVNRHTIDEENQEAPRLAKIQAGNLPRTRRKACSSSTAFATRRSQTRCGPFQRCDASSNASTAPPTCTPRSMQAPLLWPPEKMKIGCIGTKRKILCFPKKKHCCRCKAACTFDRP